MTFADSILFWLGKVAVELGIALSFIIGVILIVAARIWIDEYRIYKIRKDRMQAEK